MSERMQTQAVWSEVIYDSAIAKTAGAFDPVNTNRSEVKIAKKEAKTVLGFHVLYTLTAKTDAEITPDLILRVNSKSLGISSEEVVVPNGSKDNGANSDYDVMPSRFIPFRVPAGKDLFNADFSFTATSSVDNTGGLTVVIGVVYSSAEPDSTFAMELMAQMTGRVSGGAYAVDAAKAHATGGSAVSLTSITLPTGSRTLRGILAKVNPNGITAGDPIAGWFEFRSSGVQNFSPQEWVITAGYNPALGTVTREKGDADSGMRYFPTRFPLTGGEITVQVQSTQVVAAGAAPDTIQAVLYDY